MMLFQLLAAYCCGLFAGAAVYITFVEHPARLSCGTTIALRQFGPSYRRAAIMQASLAAIGTASAFIAWMGGGSPYWGVGGLLLGFVIPFTILIMLPVNHRLMDSALDPGSDDATRLLARWGALHAARSGASVVALIVFLVALATE